MKKYLSLLKLEFKNMWGDKMSAFMLVYPIIMLVMCGVIMPLILKKAGVNNSTDMVLIMSILVLIVLAVGSFVGGMLLGFMLLDNKDEKTFNSIAVTPLSIKGYVIFKSVFCYFISLFGVCLMVFGLKYLTPNAFSLLLPSGEVVNLLDNLPNINIVFFGIVSALMVPSIGLVSATLAKNKVEGFVYLKSGGLIILVPMLMLLDAFSGKMQYVLGVVPNFWELRAMYNLIFGVSGGSNLPFFAYLAVGAIYYLVLIVLSYRLFRKKVQISN